MSGPARYSKSTKSWSDVCTVANVCVSCHKPASATRIRFVSISRPQALGVVAAAPAQHMKACWQTAPYLADPHSVFSIPAHDLNGFFNRDGMPGMPIPSHHRLGREHGVEDRFFGGL